MKRRVAVVGSRTYPAAQTEYELSSLEQKTEYNRQGREIVKAFLDRFPYSETVIVSGGAKGPDKFAEEWADEHEVDKVIIKPDWKRYGKSAGFKRNADIVLNADDVVAFWDLESRGTKDTIKKAHRAGKPYAVFGPDEKLIAAMTEEDYQRIWDTLPEYVDVQGGKP